MNAAFFLIATIIFVIAAGMIYSTSGALCLAFITCALLTTCACIYNALNGK